jgi:transcriptional regulator with XRE-family HTH domain
VAKSPSKELRELGLAIRELRLERKLSQEELGAQSQTHRNYVGQVERGERNPSFESLLKIARALNVRLSALIELAESR